MAPHKWTNYELQTMLSLIAKGKHIQGKGKRTDSEATLKKNTYVDFATDLNKALHGDDFDKDISRTEITRQLDKMLLEHKHVLGKGGLLERGKGGRITRSLNVAMKRTGLHFDGSLGEWENGRKKKVVNEYRASRGLPPLVDEPVVVAAVVPIDVDADANAAEVAVPADAPAEVGRVFKKPGINRHRVVEVDSFPAIAPKDGTRFAPLAPSNRDAYNVLPSNLRGLGTYDWADPEAPFHRRKVPSQEFPALVGARVAPGKAAPSVPEAYTTERYNLRKSASQFPQPSDVSRENPIEIARQNAVRRANAMEAQQPDNVNPFAEIISRELQKDIAGSK